MRIQCIAIYKQYGLHGIGWTQVQVNFLFDVQVSFRCVMYACMYNYVATHLENLIPSDG